MDAAVALFKQLLSEEFSHRNDTNVMLAGVVLRSLKEHMQHSELLAVKRSQQ